MYSESKRNTHLQIFILDINFEIQPPPKDPQFLKSISEIQPPK